MVNKTLSGQVQAELVRHIKCQPMGYEQITSLSSAQGLTVPTGSDFCTLQCETQDVRMRDDGTDPTASVGQYLVANTIYEYYGDMSAVKFIETSASAKLNVHYYKDSETI